MLSHVTPGPKVVYVSKRMDLNTTLSETNAVNQILSPVNVDNVHLSVMVLMGNNSPVMV